MFSVYKKTHFKNFWNFFEDFCENSAYKGVYRLENNNNVIDLFQYQPRHCELVRTQE